jgi:hypothetical protein
MKDVRDGIVSLGLGVIRKARISNAVGTLLVLAALVTPACIIAFIFTKFWPLLILAALPVLYLFRAYDYIMKHNPEMLRTEEHEERMLEISAGMGEKGRELSEAKNEQLTSTTNVNTAPTALIQGKIVDVEKGKKP